jgi:hypothetical protein
MAKLKREPKIAASLNDEPRYSTGAVGVEFIPGPKLRAKLNISAVTLWRWRHDRTDPFPAPKIINGRLYFPLAAVTTWIANKPERV